MNGEQSPGLEVETGPPDAEGFRPVRVRTGRGEVACRHYPGGGGTGALYVGGVGGGWDTPAGGLYPRLCRELAEDGVHGLRVRFRHPTLLDEAAFDVRAGLRFLETQGVRAVALVGHSFGGAVVVRAAAAEPAVRTVATLATQAYGAEGVAQLGPRCSILLLHGTDDRVLPPTASQHLHALAREPKQLVLYPAAGHVLDEVAEDVYRDVRAWLTGELARAVGE